MELRLTFNDKGDDGSWEMQKAQRAVRADDAFSALWDLDQALRGRNKHYDCLMESDRDFLSNLKEKLSNEDYVKVQAIVEKLETAEYDFVDLLRTDIHATGLMELYN